jgi:RNA recognition motif-containing protein
MSANVVYVKNISKETSEKEVKDFFSFCGKITQLEVTSTGETQNATVTFEKETAAKTALLLDNTQLGKTQVSVSSATGGDDFGHSTNDNEEGDEIAQEQKPRSRIIAEYLAHGYIITDQTAEKAIDLDKKHGISNRFLETLQKLDQKVQASSKAKVVDEKYDITNKATQTVSSIWSGLSSYYEKAAGTPTGQKFVDFYTKSSQQVQDIHAEARRLADLKKKEAAGTSSTVPDTEKTSSVHEKAEAGTGIIADSTITPLEK